MNTRLETLLRRRQILVDRAAGQRNELARIVQPWKTPLSIVDRGIEIIRALRSHPLLLGLGVALIMRTGRRNLDALAGRLMAAWQLYHVFRTHFRADNSLVNGK